MNDHLDTEEATRTPFSTVLQMLGYSIFDPTEVVPEFTADVGTKKGFDYAFVQDEKPFLIECKIFGSNLQEKVSNSFATYCHTPVSAPHRRRVSVFLGL